MVFSPIAATLPICYQHLKVCYPVLLLEIVTNIYMSHRYTHWLDAYVQKDFQYFLTVGGKFLQGKIKTSNLETSFLQDAGLVFSGLNFVNDHQKF